MTLQEIKQALAIAILCEDNLMIKKYQEMLDDYWFGDDEDEHGSINDEEE